MKVLSSAVILGLLVLFSVPCVTAEQFDYRKSLAEASKLVAKYLEIKSPTPQDLEEFKANQLVRNYGATAVRLKMAVEAIFMNDGQPSESFDAARNLKMFNLLEILLPLPSAPVSGDRNELETLRSVDGEKESGLLMAAGLDFMIRTSEAERDPVSAQKYYDRLQKLPEPKIYASALAGSKTSGAVPLLRLYCQMGDLASAAGVYDGLAEIKGGYSRRNKGKAAAILVGALAEAGQVTEAQKYYLELDAAPGADGILGKIKAGQALASGYRKIGDTEAAKKLENEIEIMTEQQRLKEAENKAELEKVKAELEKSRNQELLRK